MRDFLFPEKPVQEAQILPGRFRGDADRASLRQGAKQKHLCSYKRKTRDDAGTGVRADRCVRMDICPVDNMQKHPVHMQYAFGVSGRAGGIQEHRGGIFRQGLATDLFLLRIVLLIHENDLVRREMQWLLLPEFSQRQDRFCLGILQHIGQAIHRVLEIKGNENCTRTKN